jgi:hypothetical protein
MTSLTIDGYKMEVKAVSPLAPKAIELQYKQKNPEPKPPTYTIEAVAGVTETFNHTLETVTTPEEKEAFALYQDAHTAWTAELSFKLLKLFLSEGVTLKLTKKQADDFNSRARAIGIDVPENKYARNLFYLETFIITDETKIQKVTDAVMAETGIKREAIAAAEELFRPGVE